MSSGIYSITNTTNGCRYVGSACDLRARWGEHLHALRNGAHHSRYLQRAFDKHGEAEFKFETLLYCDREHLILFEQRAMDVLRPEYNICRTAGSCLGRLFSDESKAKMSATRRGRRFLPQGYRHSFETRAKLSAAKKGKKLTAEHRAKIGTSGMGKKHTAEQNARQSERQKGRKHTPETRAKLSTSHAGKTLSAEHRAKISAGVQKYLSENRKRESHDAV